MITLTLNILQRVVLENRGANCTHWTDKFITGECWMFSPKIVWRFSCFRFST